MLYFVLFLQKQAFFAYRKLRSETDMLRSKGWQIVFLLASDLLVLYLLAK